MNFLWDSNVLRHYVDNHPQLLENLKKVRREDVMLPVVVVAEQQRGRVNALLTAEPARLARVQDLFRRTQTLLSRFRILYFDEESLAVVSQLVERVRTSKRYADVLIAAQAIAGRHVLVTRNTDDFRDLLSTDQLQNWIDDKIS